MIVAALYGASQGTPLESARDMVGPEEIRRLAHDRQPEWRYEMPRGTKEGSKRERQYEHIKDSYEDRGVSKDEAEERAARTVNKQRRESGETRSKKD
jgi:hypothetical protein